MNHRLMLDELSNTTSKQLQSNGTIIDYKKNTIIFSDDEKDYIYFVLDGFVALYRNSHFGQDRIIFICGPKELLNESGMGIMSSGICAKTISNVSLLQVPCDVAYSIFSSNCDDFKLLFQAVCAKTRRLYHQVGNDSGTYTLKQHLAVKIWKLAHEYGVNTPLGISLPFEINVTMISMMLGAKRESVSREISKMKSGNLIKIENGTLTVPNMDILKNQFATLH